MKKFTLLVFLLILIHNLISCRVFQIKPKEIIIEKEKIVYYPIPDILFNNCKIIVPFESMELNNVNEIMIEDLLLLINTLSTENLKCYDTIKKIKNLQTAIITEVKK
jgi:hypothetical protein